MPMLQLLIKNDVIEEVVLQLKGKTFEHRQAEVNAASDFLKYKYRQSILLRSNWEIRIVGLQSKMN